MNNTNESNSSEKGFSGLSLMVSDVSEEIKAASKAEIVREEATDIHQQATASQEPDDRVPTSEQSSSPALGGNISKGMLWGGAIIVGIIFIFAFGNSKDNSYQSNPPSPAISYSVPAQEPAAIPQAKPTANRGEMPPVGNGLVLSRDQIKYCLVQDIRIDAVKKVIKNTKKSEVDSFNRVVSDYNSRCSHFKFRSGALESIQAEISKERSEIERVAKTEWVRGSLGLDKPTSGKAGKQSDKPKTLQATEANVSKPRVTRYEPPIVAPASSEPRNQTPANQAPRTVPNTGIPANAHLASWGSDWECDRGYRKQGGGCTKVDIPMNGHLASWGSDWECDRGYRKQGNGCTKVDIPLNGHLASWGSDWECDKGYRKQGNGCANEDIPANAHLASWGSDWQCDSGYKKQGNACARVDIPVNGHLASWGSDWECDKGYRKQGNSCIRVEIPVNAHLASWGSDFECDRGYQRSGNACVPVGQSLQH